MLVACAVLLGGCGSAQDAADEVVTVDPELPSPDVTATPSPGCDEGDVEAEHPDVVGATARQDGAEWELEATLCSPYDSEERYADAWRALAPDGTVLATRDLTHPHPDEQPFTRGTSIPLPDDVTTLVFEGRDSVNGWGGATVEVEIR